MTQVHNQFIEEVEGYDDYTEQQRTPPKPVIRKVKLRITLPPPVIKKARRPKTRTAKQLQYYEDLRDVPRGISAAEKKAYFAGKLLERELVFGRQLIKPLTNNQKEFYRELKSQPKELRREWMRKRREAKVLDKALHLTTLPERLAEFRAKPQAERDAIMARNAEARTNRLIRGTDNAWWSDNRKAYFNKLSAAKSDRQNGG
jgi:hypothetical protein